MAIGYDIVVESVGDIGKGERLVVVCTKKGITLHDRNDKVVTSVLYPNMRLKVLKIYEHTPFIQICSDGLCKTLEYNSLKEAKNIYRIFKLALKNSKQNFIEHSTKAVPDEKIKGIAKRVCLYLKSDNFELIFKPLKPVHDIEEWAKEKIEETFKDITWF